MPEDERAQPLTVEHQPVAVPLDLVVAVPEPDEAVQGLLLVRESAPPRRRSAAGTARPSGRVDDPVHRQRRSRPAGSTRPVRASGAAPGGRCTDPGWCADGRSRRTAALDCGVAGPSATCATRAASSPSGSSVTVGRRPRATAAEDEVLHARSRGRCTARGAAGRPRRCRATSSTNTSMRVVAEREGPGLGVVRAGGQHGAGHRAERAGQVAPLGPRVVRRAAARVEGRAVVHAVAEHPGAGHQHRRAAESHAAEQSAAGEVAVVVGCGGGHRSRFLVSGSCHDPDTRHLPGGRAPPLAANHPG